MCCVHMNVDSCPRRVGGIVCVGVVGGVWKKDLGLCKSSVHLILHHFREVLPFGRITCAMCSH